MIKHVAVAGCTAVLVGGLAACDSGSGSKKAADARDGRPVAMSPVAAVKKAADANVKLTSMKVQGSGKAPGQGRFEYTAVIGFKSQAMDMTMKVLEGPETGEVRMRLTDGALYVNGGEEAAKEMEGKHWIKFDLEAMGEGADPFAEASGQARRDPSAETDLLTESDDVKKVGTETVDGVETTHYTGTVDVDDLAADKGEVGAERAERREMVIKQLKDIGVETLAMDIWIGPDHHTVKFRERADTDQGPLDVTMRFLDVNVPVTVKAPPASDTVDLQEMVKGLEG